MKNFSWFRKLIFTIAVLIVLMCVSDAFAKSKKVRFYDFSDQLIDGRIKKPSTIWMESRSRAKFAKLLRLKKSFRSALIMSGKDPILK